MEERRRYIEQVIAENSKNEMEAAAIRAYSIREEGGFPTPQNDLPNLKRDRIELELINDTNTPQTISLFALPLGINPSQGINYGDLTVTKYSEGLIPLSEFPPTTIAQQYQIDWIDQNGTPQVFVTPLPAITSISELIAAMNLGLNDSFDYRVVGSDYLIYKLPIDTWLYWTPPPIGTPPPAGTLPTSFYTENQISRITGLNTLNIFGFQNTDVLGGSAVQVVDLSGNLTYIELIQELKNNITPYIFDEITIYANTIDQANMPITKEIRGQAGNTKKLIDNPTIFHQNQFVVTKQISLPSKSLNSLIYTLLPNQRTRVILNYSKGNLNAIADVINEYLSDGIPFNVAITQLSEAVNEKEKEYLESTLKSIWNRKKKEFSREGIDIDIDSIFAPQEYINSKKREFLGIKMQAVKNHIEKNRAEAINIKGTSSKNIKNIVANYVAKGDADEIFDPYSYVDG